MKTHYALTWCLSLIIGFSAKAQVTATLTPVDDAYFISMGGGQGCNPLLKFNISSIPAGSNLVKANLYVYVFDTTNATQLNAHCGNMVFRNLNNKQNWTEFDSAYSFSPNLCMYSDSVTQLSGFGDSIGWAMSANLIPVIAKDFNASNTFCTISMKDPDDVTCCGAHGPSSNFNFLGNESDSVVCGNKMVGADEMIFYPKDYSNAQLRPYLVIQYTCSKPNTQNVTLCAGQSLTVGTSTYTQTGNYVDTLTCVNGCDSVVTTNLTVNPAIDISVSVAGNTITSNETNCTYQWLQCGNGKTPINNETNQSMTVSSSGNYAVAINKNGCKDTSACTSVVFTQVDMHAKQSLTIYPNPTSGLVNIAGLNKDSQVEVIDMMGRKICQFTGSDKTLIDLRNEQNGIYIVKITNGNKNSFYRVTKD